MDGDKLRDGIFALRTRRFGSVAECMIKRLLKYSKARSLFHDLYDDQRKHRIEVKFSVVQKKAETTVTEETVLRCIEESVAENRMVAFSEDIKENSKGGRILYSDRQHKGNIGEGQFHINSQTFQIHLDHYQYKTLSYDELYQVLAGK